MRVAAAVRSRRRGAHGRDGLRALLVLAALAPAGALAQDLGIHAVVPEPSPTWSERVDRLLGDGRAAAAMGLLDAVLVGAPSDFGAHWRAARACYYLGVLEMDPRARNAAWRRGMAWAERALEARPDDPDALRWGIAVLGSLANDPEVGPRETARLAQRTWDLVGRLLASHPDDPMGHSAYGTLHAEIMTLSGFERFLGRVFLGAELLGKANWEDALAHQERAVLLDPGQVLYRLELAKALAWYGQAGTALSVLRDALALPARTPLDEARHRDARELLARLEAKRAR